MDGGWRILIGGLADDARSGWSRKFTTSLWEGSGGASCAIQTASPENQHATRFRVARQLSQGAGVRRKPEDQPRLDWRTQGTEVGGSRQPAQAGDAAATESRELVASFAEGCNNRRKPVVELSALPQACNLRRKPRVTLRAS